MGWINSHITYTFGYWSMHVESNFPETLFFVEHFVIVLVQKRFSPIPDITKFLSDSGTSEFTSAAVNIAPERVKIGKQQSMTIFADFDKIKGWVYADHGYTIIFTPWHACSYTCTFEQAADSTWIDHAANVKWRELHEQAAML